MNYLQIYKSLIELVSKANLTPLAQDNFVIQEDAYQRIADEENLDEVFLRYSYKAGTHDNYRWRQNTTYSIENPRIYQ
jgi:hypothetical protein